MSERNTTLIICALFIILSVCFVYGIAGRTSACTQCIHGIYHSAYVYQIANGVIPPTNPYSVGMPASNYWGWYLLLALIMQAFNITSFEASLLVNALVLILFLTAFWIATGVFIRNSFARLAFCTVPFILLTPVELVKMLFRYMQDLHHMPRLEDFFPSVSILGMTLEKRCLFLPIFLNFNGFPTGVALFAALAALVMKPLRNRKLHLGLCLLGAFFTAFFHPASALGVSAIAMAGGGMAMFRFIVRPQRNLSEFLNRMAPFIFIVLGLACALPYMMSLSRALGRGIALNYHLNTLLIAVLFSSWTIGPSLLIYLLGLLRFQKLSDQGRLALLAGLAILAGHIFIIIYDNTQYQLAILSTVPTTLLMLSLYQSCFSRRKLADTRWHYPLLALLLLLALIGVVNIKAVMAIYQIPNLIGSDPYLYNGQAIELKVDPRNAKLQSRVKAYQWLRCSTPPDAYFLEQPFFVMTYQEALVSSVVTQRRNIVSSPNMYTKYIPHHNRLFNACVEFLADMQQCNLTGEKVSRLFAMPVPWPDDVYVLIDKTKSYSATYHLNERDCLSGAAEVISTAYANNHFIIYRVRNPHRPGKPATAAVGAPFAQQTPSP